MRATNNKYCVSIVTMLSITLWVWLNIVSPAGYAATLFATAISYYKQAATTFATWGVFMKTAVRRLDLKAKILTNQTGQLQYCDNYTMSCARPQVNFGPWSMLFKLHNEVWGV